MWRSDEQTTAVQCSIQVPYKFKVALAAVRGDKTLSQLAQEFQLHPSQISTWKQQLLEEGERVFERGGGRSEREQAAREAALYEQIGRLRMELEWLKKKLAPFDRG